TPLDPGEWLLVGVIVDVTLRRQAEEALRVSEARYRQLVEHSPLAILEVDISGISSWVAELHDKGVTNLPAYLDSHPEEYILRQANTRVMSANNAAMRLLRAPSVEAVSKYCGDPAKVDLDRIRRNVLYALFDRRLEVDGEHTFSALDGTSVRIVYHWWVPVIAGHPNLRGSQLVLVDLSDITRAENALAAERERLSVTLRAMSEAVLTTDTDGVVQYTNAAAEQITGWSSAESVGRDLMGVCALQHARTQTSVVLPTMAELAKTLVADFPPHTALRQRSGSTLLVEGRYAALHGADGVLLGAVLVLRDMTEKARLEAEQLRSSKLESLGILAGGIAHDFNNLLTVVMGNLTLAMLDTQVMSAAGRWLRESERGVLRARDLTQQLLTFAKGGDPVRTAVSLADVVRETAEFAMHGAKARCVFEFAPDLWPAEVDKVQIGQVVQN
ncbi:MAG: PAS domain S-box protein, partial [Opitutaceae bacterium]